MANLNVTYQEMNDVAQQLDIGKQELNDVLTRLSGVINNLVASGFQTELASGAFSQTYEDFTSGTTKAIGGLDGLSLFLKKAAEAMASTDAELAKAIQQ
jgi:WXG100 family type VII secretion target